MIMRSSGDLQLWGEIILDLWERHRGKIAGLLAGLLFGLLVLALGFWRSLFVSLCMAAGFVIGKRIDEKGNWRELYQDLFRGK